MKENSLLELLRQPLLGKKKKRTSVGIVYIFSISCLIILSNLSGDSEFLLALTETVFGELDRLRTFTIILAVVSVFLSIIYPVWNRGPVLAASIGITPFLVGSLVSGHFVIEMDLVLGACAGSLGASIATYRTAKTEEGNRKKDTINSLVFSSGITVFSLISLFRVYQEDIFEVETGAVFGFLFLVFGLSFLVYVVLDIL